MPGRRKSLFVSVWSSTFTVNRQLDQLSSNVPDFEQAWFNLHQRTGAPARLDAASIDGPDNHRQNPFHVQPRHLPRNRRLNHHAVRDGSGHVAEVFDASYRNPVRLDRDVKW